MNEVFSGFIATVMARKKIKKEHTSHATADVVGQILLILLSFTLQ
jgi:hypothetical protein